MRRCTHLLLALSLFVAACADARAATRFWDGGDGVWLEGFELNWTPRDEPDFDDTAHFTTASQVRLGSNNSVDEVVVFGAAHLTTEAHLLDVHDDVTLLGQLTVGGNFLTSPPTVGLRAGSIAVTPGAFLKVGGTHLEYNVPSVDGATGVISNLGTISGNGAIRNFDVTDTPFTMFTNSGTLNVQPVYRPGVFVPLGSVNPPLTLRIDAHSLNARVDLDGNDAGSGPGEINIWRNQMLDVDVRPLDAMSGAINLVHNSTLDMQYAWRLDSGTITADNGYVPFSIFFPAVPADTSYIRGGELTQMGGRIEVLDLDGTLQFDAAFHMEAGEFVNNGIVISNYQMNLDDGARLTGDGTLINGAASDTAWLNIQRLAVVQADVENHGVMDINWLGADLASIAGDFTQTSTGLINLDLAGTGIRQHDSLFVDHAQLDGALKVYRSGGFVPQLGDSFQILNAATISGSFASIDQSAAGLGPGLTLEANYFTHHVSLRVELILPGDFNNDGVVDTADFGVWRDNLGATSTLPGDPSPGYVTVDDYRVWRDNFGSVAAATVATVTATPEPATMLLTALGLIATIAHRGRRG